MPWYRILPSLLNRKNHCRILLSSFANAGLIHHSSVRVVLMQLCTRFLLPLCFQLLHSLLCAFLFCLDHFWWGLFTLRFPDCRVFPHQLQQVHRSGLHLQEYWGSSQCQSNGTCYSWLILYPWVWCTCSQTHLRLKIWSYLLISPWIQHSCILGGGILDHGVSSISSASSLHPSL